mgnify:CR=1 FL=1
MICNSNTEHHITKKIWQQPTITIIRLNRIKQLRTGRIHKDTSTVLCDNHLATLIAAVFHKGTSTDNGHYTSVVKSNNIWYNCNDHTVRPTQYTDFCSSKEVYMAFYHKLD